MKNIVALLLIPFALSVFTGCNKTEEDSSPRKRLFDPKVPGGQVGGSVVIEPVDELEADVSVVGEIKLTWSVSSLYHPLPYKVRIYKHRGNSPNWFLPDPSQMYNAAELYKVAELDPANCENGHCSSWTDKNPEDGSSANVIEDTDYKYWVFIFLNNTWSQSKEILAHSNAGGAGFNLPSAANFWKQKMWDLGNKPNKPQGQTNEYQSVSTLEPRQTSCETVESKSQLDSLFNANKTSCSSITGCSWNQKTPSCNSVKDQNSCNSNSECNWNALSSTCSSMVYACRNESHIGNMKGKTAFAMSGAVMYVADTDNNRIVIYTREAALACEQYKSDEEIFQACQYQAQGFPFQPKNVLGQPNQYGSGTCNLSCQSKSTSNSCEATSGCGWNIQKAKCEPNFGYDKCMFKPSYVTVHENKLIVSDSGNNRLMVWDTLPLNGCDPEVIPGQLTSTEPCAASYQIGKKSFEDFSSYTIAQDGAKIFNNPNGTFVKGEDLYVADTGNHRVIKLAKFEDSQMFSCNETNWNTSLCMFSSVLGQPSFNTRKTFKDFAEEDLSRQQQCAVASNPAPPGNPDGSKSQCESVSVGCTWSPGQIIGTGSCSLTNTLFDKVGIGNIIGSSNAHLLKRYFANPTVVKISDDNKLLVAANEDFQSVSTINSPIYMKSRILGWNVDPLDGVSPVCSFGSFPAAGCDADFVIGQYDFKTLVAMQGSAAKYSDVSYGLESLVDFDITGKHMVGVDSLNNFVYLWNDWKSSTAPGRPPTARALDPEGATNPSTGQSLPDLKGLGSITLVPETLLLYITDGSNSKVHEVKSY